MITLISISEAMTPARAGAPDLQTNANAAHSEHPIHWGINE